MGPDPAPILEGGSVEERVARKLEHHDANKDGAIDAEEAKGCRHLAEMFAKADADSDGKVTKAEMTRSMADEHAGAPGPAEGQK